MGCDEVIELTDESIDPVTYGDGTDRQPLAVRSYV